MSPEDVKKIYSYYDSLTDGLTFKSRGDFMNQFTISTDYHAANCNCTTVAMDGIRIGEPELHKNLNQSKFDQGRGLGFFQRSAYNLKKEGDGVRLPLDLKAAVESHGKATSVNTYNNRQK